jgi:phosphoribosylformylglycinamidine (FGAM) synthase-like enzyme
MSPREIWCNEAQERYVLAIRAEICRFPALCERERCPFAVLGTATDDGPPGGRRSKLEAAPVDVDLSMILGKPPKMLRDVKRLAPRRRLALAEIQLARRRTACCAIRRWRQDVPRRRSAIAPSAACARAIRSSGPGRCRWRTAR